MTTQLLIDRAKAEQNTISKYHELVKQNAQEDALADFSGLIATPLSQAVSEAESDHELEPDLTKSITELLRGTRTVIVRDPNLNPQLIDERTSIDVIIEWLQDHQNSV